MDPSQVLFSALDNAKIQIYHLKAIVIAGMGIFTDAYDLFCITAVAKLIGRLYYFDPASHDPGILPVQVSIAVTGVALGGTLAGQLFFGWLGDKLGRKKFYGITLVIMVGCAMASGLSFGSTPKSVVTTLCFFRFWLGFGIGGDYPLSAVIMSEYANQKTRGAFIAAVFAMQGVGILAAGAVSMIVSAVFLSAYPADDYSTDPMSSTQPEGDFVWRIVLVIGAIPAALTYYWRMKMPETARYTALVEGNHRKAVADMARVLEIDIPLEESSSRLAVNLGTSYGLFSRKFLEKHGLHLLGTTSTWFLMDIGFYGLQLAQKDIYPAIGLVLKASEMNAIEEVFQLSRAMFVVSLFATVPGYWFTVFLVDRIGRYNIQLNGFLIMSICMWIIGKIYGDYKAEECPPESNYNNCDDKMIFLILFGTTLFFANFGPNSTTFIVPAELFPARFRSTCHGISAAAGKAGAITGVFVVQSFVADTTNGIEKTIKAIFVVNLVGLLFTLLVPETKGQSLETMSGEDKEFDGIIIAEDANQETNEAKQETQNISVDKSLPTSENTSIDISPTSENTSVDKSLPTSENTSIDKTPGTIMV